jgi:hypothetical protein
MTDLLTPEERELVEELRPIEIERTRKFLAILDRLAPKPQPQVFWIALARNRENAEWVLGTFSNEIAARHCAEDNADGYRVTTRIVKSVEAAS